MVYKNISGPEGVQVLPLNIPSKLPEVIEKAIESLIKMKEKKMLHVTEMEEEQEEEPAEQT